MNQTYDAIRATVAQIVECQGHYLMVHEIEDGHRVINQPAGHIEPGEDILSAVERETFEETGLHIKPQRFLGIYQSLWEEKSRHYLRFCFISHLDEQLAPTPQDSDIIHADWLTRDAILDNTQHRLRSELVRSCLIDFEAQPNYPLEVVQALLRSC